jgi:Domain of unknown function (DUF6702)
MIGITKNTLGILLFAYQLSFPAMHAIHISYGKATLNGNEFYGKLTFYYDDFMLALKNWEGTELNNFTSEQYTRLKDNYLQSHLNVIANNKKLKLIITGNGGNEKSIWFEFKFISGEKINSLNLKYNVLMNEYSDQLNLLNVSSTSGDQSFIFSESKPELKILN